MLLTLQRFAHTPEFGTFGMLTCGDLQLYTVEQDWENNQPFISCVPNGIYVLEKHDSPTHGASLILSNPDLNIGKYPGEAKRNGCLIHIANLASQLEGCIAPGKSLGFYKNQWSVSSSGDALSEILNLLDDGTHKLVITSSFPDFIEG